MGESRMMNKQEMTQEELRRLGRMTQNLNTPLNVKNSCGSCLDPEMDPKDAARCYICNWLHHWRHFHDLKPETKLDIKNRDRNAFLICHFCMSKGANMKNKLAMISHNDAMAKLRDEHKEALSAIESKWGSANDEYAKIKAVLTNMNGYQNFRRSKQARI